MHSKKPDSEFGLLRERKIAADFLGLAMAVGLPGFTVIAAGLNLTGVAEGSSLPLTSPANSLEIVVSAVPVGVGGSGDVEWVLEGRGSVVETKTTAPSASVAFSGLTVGKYFLSARHLGAGGGTGDVSFDVVRAVVVPGNDSWAGAVPLIRGVTVQGNNRAATVESGEPRLAWNQSGGTVWWSWTAPDSGIATATTRGSGFDTVLGVFSGTDVATLRALGVNDDMGSESFSQVTFQHAAGTTYYLAVDGVWRGEAGPASGSVSLQLLAGKPPQITQVTPVDGAMSVVPTSQSTTNLVLTVAVEGELDAVGLTSTLVSEAGLKRTAAVPGSRTWTETGIGLGEYTWTVQGTDPQGLIGVWVGGFSVVTSETEVQFAEVDPEDPGLVPLLIRGMPGRAVRFETSTDLIEWKLGERWPVFDGWVRIPDMDHPMPDVRFYRARNE